MTAEPREIVRGAVRFLLQWNLGVILVGVALILVGLGLLALAAAIAS